MNKYNRNHINEEYITNEGCKAIIINGDNKPKYCIIKMNNYIKEVSYDSLKKGQVKNPFKPRIYNIGFLGVGKYKTYCNKKMTKAYCT